MCACDKEIETERNREKDIVRKRDRQTDRETDRRTDRETAKDRVSKREKEREREREREREMWAQRFFNYISSNSGATGIALVFLGYPMLRDKLA